MNKVMRAVVMSGVAVAAGLTVAAGPASAAPSSAATPSVGEKRVAAQPQSFRHRSRIQGVYRSLRTCHRVGEIGRYKGYWGRYSCIRTYRGWALRVSSGYYGGHHGGYSGGGYGGGAYGGGFYGGY